MRLYLLMIILVLSSVPALAGLQDDGEEVSRLVSPYITSDTLIVRGTYASKIEKAVLAYIRMNYPQAKDVPVVYDSKPM